MTLAAPADRFAGYLTAGTQTEFHPLRHLSRKSASPVSNIKCLLELYRLFRRERPDVALLYTIKPNILGNFAAVCAGVRTISVVEGLGYGGSLAARWRWVAAPLYRLALLRAYRVVFLNEDDRQEFLQSRLVTPGQARLVHGPGVDSTHFAPAPAKKSASLVFLFSGRLLSEKGIFEFVSAAREIRRENPAVECWVLGAPDSGNPSAVAPSDLDHWIAEGVVKYLDKAEDVRPTLALADVLVLPSYYREGVPRSVLEAMAMEKIVITTDTPGCRDTVEESRNGFLVPPRDVQALVAAMLRVLALTPEQRVQMGARSRQKVEEMFSDARVLPHYLVEIAEAVERR